MKTEPTGAFVSAPHTPCTSRTITPPSNPKGSRPTSGCRGACGISKNYVGFFYAQRVAYSRPPSLFRPAALLRREDFALYIGTNGDFSRRGGDERLRESRGLRSFLALAFLAVVTHAGFEPAIRMIADICRARSGMRDLEVLQTSDLIVARSNAIANFVHIRRAYLQFGETRS